MMENGTVSDTDPTVTAKTINQMRKWRCYFNRKVSFLERIEKPQPGYGYTGDQMLKGLPELLRGETLLWYRNQRSTWAKWEDFLYAFREQYLPRRHRNQLQQQIQGRLQQEGESFGKYLTDIMTMMRRAGGFSRHEQVERIYDNMTPDLQLYIR